MTATCYLRGHEAHFNGKDWFYLDNSEPVTDRPCIRCGKTPTPEGHDACLGYIKGATAACCGHGIEESYVKHEGEEAMPEQLNVRIADMEQFQDFIAAVREAIDDPRIPEAVREKVRVAAERLEAEGKHG